MNVEIRRLHIPLAAALSLIMAVLIIEILLVCDGRLIYSLDDPYISLGLARHIAQGEYGINAGEAASPASSILYPLVLAGFAWASWQQFVPLALNMLAAIATGLLFTAALCRYRILADPSQFTRGAVLVLTVCIAVNTVGLVFVGLEHSLHALTSVFVVLALARALEEDRVPGSLVIAIVLLPLWRFEGMALALLAMAALAVTGHRRPAAMALAAVALSLSGYVVAMHALGLPSLPSSVLTKSAVAERLIDASAGPADLMELTLRDAVGRLTLEAVPLLLLIAVILAHPAMRVRRRGNSADERWSLWRETVFALVVGGTLVAHALFGSWGWFARYEAYAVAVGAAGALILWRRPIAALVARESPVYDGLALAALLSLGQAYALATLKTPFAAGEIYQQQYQMHRFAVDFYRRPVAVNDIGWVSYDNPNYVLDLIGLGSETARHARAEGQICTDWMSDLVTARGVGVAMIYDQLFAGQRPPQWHRLAVLRSSFHVVSGYDTVTFYATSDEAVGPALAALRAFAHEPGRGAKLTLLAAPAPPEQTAWHAR